MDCYPADLCIYRGYREDLNTGYAVSGFPAAVKLIYRITRFFIVAKKLLANPECEA